MNKLKELLAAKMKEIKGLETKVAEGDEEAVKSASTLATEIADLQAKIKASEDAMAKIKSIGTHEEPTPDTPKEKPAKTLGEHFVKSITLPTKGQHFDVVAPAFKAATDTQTVPAAIAQYFTQLDRNVVTAPRTEINVRDLFANETITGNALTYLVEGVAEGDYKKVLEGTSKGQIHFADPTPKTVSLDKIAAFIKESDEYSKDAAFLASSINGRLMYMLDLYEQNALITSLLATSGIQTDTADFTSAVKIADAIAKAKKNVKKLSGFPADTILINPDLNYLLDTGKDNNGQYYGGGYFGNPSVQQVWGLNVVESDKVTGFVVGSFKACASVVTNGEGQSVEMTNSDADDFTKNLMTIRAEERLTLAVRRPAGFVNVTKAA